MSSTPPGGASVSFGKTFEKFVMTCDQLPVFSFQYNGDYQNHSIKCEKGGKIVVSYLISPGILLYFHSHDHLYATYTLKRAALEKILSNNLIK